MRAVDARGAAVSRYAASIDEEHIKEAIVVVIEERYPSAHRLGKVLLWRGARVMPEAKSDRRGTILEAHLRQAEASQRQAKQPTAAVHGKVEFQCR